MIKERVIHVFDVTQEESDAKASTRGEAIMRARVFRAATGKWEEIGIVYRGPVKEVKSGHDFYAGRGGMAGR